MEVILIMLVALRRGVSILYLLYRQLFITLSSKYHYFLALGPPSDPCSPSPCGPNSKCRRINGQPACSCLPKYVGEPPNCKPECRVGNECPNHLACVNNKCADPCPNTWGLGAQCLTKNHSPICTCPPGFTGDPFSQCYEHGNLFFKFYRIKGKIS